MQGLRHALWLSALLMVGCGSKISGSDSNSFATVNRAKIDFDCQQTRICDEERNKNMAPNCVQREIDQFARMPSTQAPFLSRSNRCSVFTGCDYFDCTLRDTAGYGETQMDKITYACEQKISCSMESGQNVADPALQIANCTAANIGTLFNFKMDDRIAFENAFAMCSSMNGCAFSQCFPY